MKMIEGMETRISSISKDIAEFLMNVMGYKDVASVSFVQRFRSGSWKLCDRTIRNVFIYISNNISCPLDEFKSNLDFFDSILELNEELILEDFMKLRQFSDFDSIYESIQNRCEFGRNVILLKRTLLEMRVEKLGDL